MKIKSEIFRQITTQNFIKETCGLLGGVNGTVKYHYQSSTHKDERCACYLEGEKIGEIITQWRRNGIDFYGIYHTHPVCDDRLSSQDITYIKAIMASLPEIMKYLYFPVILPNKKMTVYKAVNNGQIIIIKEPVIQVDV